MNRFVVLLVALLVAQGGCSKKEGKDRAARSWPRRAIQVSCFAAAGGGTDMVNRAIGAAMEGDLGVRVNVVNRLGGRGGVAMSYVWTREHDGHHWGGFSESILPAAVMGGHDTTARDWTIFSSPARRGCCRRAATVSTRPSMTSLPPPDNSPARSRSPLPLPGGYGTPSW